MSMPLSMEEDVLVSYTLFPDIKPTTKSDRSDVPWSDLVARIRDAPIYIDKAHCPLISLAEYGDVGSAVGCLRHGDNVRRVFGVEIDYDGEEVSLEQGAELLRLAHLQAVLYTSPSHRSDRPRWRALLPLADPAIPEKRAEYVGRVNRALGGLATRESFTLSQSFYIGRVRGAEYEVIETQGRAVDMASELEPLYFAGQGADGSSPRDPTTDAELRACFDRGEDRYQSMLKLSSRWAAKGMAADDIEVALLEMLGNAPHNGDGVDLRTRARPLALSAVRKFGETRPAVTPAVEPEVVVDDPKRKPVAWSALQGRALPEREWAIDHWLPMGHVTLLAGAAGAGKTLVAQALSSCLCLQREYLDYVPKARRVLMWACEDEHDELWRRQSAIGTWLQEPLGAFAEKFTLFSYQGKLVELAGITDQKLSVQPMFKELREQIGDYRSEVVVLDNIARLYGGNENDRHQVTSFVAMLTNAAASTNAAVLLLGHPGKAIGSEYSGSTAWEGAVRGRLYLGRKLPDEEGKETGPEEPEPDETLRYLCRRKANYSSRDFRRLKYADGVMTAEPAPEPGQSTGVSSQYAEEVVVRAVRALAAMKEHGNASTASPQYLPRLAQRYKLLDKLSTKQFTAVMYDLHAKSILAKAAVGMYPNRSPRFGLVVTADAAPIPAQM